MAPCDQWEDIRMKIGITGHQRLDDPSAWDWVASALSDELDILESPVTAISSLAIGADQLFATLVVRRGGQIYAVIPFSGYERAFAPEDIKGYWSILSKASSVEILETPGTDEEAFLAAGRRVVELAELMIAVWNGKPAEGKGGTGDIVSYTIGKGTPLIHINPLDHTITRM